MPKRRDNMLEAFRASAEAEKRARELREAAALDDARRAQARQKAAAGAAAGKTGAGKTGAGKTGAGKTVSGQTAAPKTGSVGAGMRSGVDAPVLQPKRAKGAPQARSPRSKAPAAPAQVPAPRAPQPSKTQPSQTAPSQTSPAAGRSSGAPPPSAPQPLAPIGPDAHVEIEDGLVLPMGGITFLAVLVALLGLSFSLGWLAGRGPQDGAGDGLSDAGESELRSGDSASLGMPNTRGSWNAAGTSGVDLSLGANTSNPGGTPGVSVGSLPAPDRALANPSNKYTVLALTHKDDSRGAELMQIAREYILGQQFPAARPIQHKGQLLLFVGAAERVVDLQDLQRQLGDLMAPNGRDRYLREPYTVTIDQYRVPARPSSAGALGDQR